MGPRPPLLSSVLSALFLIFSPATSAQTFLPVSSLPEGAMGHSLLEAAGYLYNIGGLGAANGIGSGRNVFRAPIQGPGQLGSWEAAEPLPVASFFHAGAAGANVLYVIGGQHFSSQGLKAAADVYFSRVDAEGRPGPWLSTQPLPKPLYLHSAAVWEGTIYVTGGWSGAGLSASVYSADIQADGGLGPWIERASLPEAVYTHATVQHGTLYVVGGIVNGGNEIHSGVYYARIRPDKSLEPWLQTTPLPGPVGNHAAVVAGGRVQVLGGMNGSGLSAATLSAPMLPDAQLGDWSGGPSLPVPLQLHRAAFGGGAIWVSGGNRGAGPEAGVYSLTLDERLVAAVDLDPDKLNLMSQGQFVTCYLEFPDGRAAAAAIDPASVRVSRVNGAAAALGARSSPTGVGDENANGVEDRMLKFDREAFAALLAQGDNRVEIEGRLSDGRSFSGEGAVWATSRDGKRATAAALPSVALPGKAALALLSERGGSVRGGGAGVDIPPGAMKGAGVSVRVEEEPDPELSKPRTDALGRQALAAVGDAVEFGPHGLSFSQPATLELPYDPALLPPGGEEGSLQVHYWNAAAGAWEALPSVVDKTARLVRAQTTHFSLYQVLFGGSPAAAAAGLAFGEVYAFPNPARGKSPTIHVEAGSADRVEIRIYDLSGERVHEANVQGPAPLIDDGSGRGPVASFEYAWDVSGVGSGVYLYVVTAHKDGASVRKSGKVAVIR